MSTAGTIDRPGTLDPSPRPSQLRSTATSAEIQVAMATDHTIRTLSAAPAAHPNGSSDMHLIPEALARAHIDDRLHEAASERTAIRLTAARRLQRRAERASLRARRALAMAVMQ